MVMRLPTLGRTLVFKAARTGTNPTHGTYARYRHPAAFGDWVLWRAAFVATIFWQIKDVAIGQPSQLRCQFITFAQCGIQGDGEAAFDLANDFAFYPTDMINIGDDAFAHLPRTGAMMATPPGDILMTWQGYSFLFSNMKRPSRLTCTR